MSNDKAAINMELSYTLMKEQIDRADDETEIKNKVN